MDIFDQFNQKVDMEFTNNDILDIVNCMVVSFSVFDEQIKEHESKGDHFTADIIRGTLRERKLLYNKLKRYIDSEIFPTSTSKVELN